MQPVYTPSDLARRGDADLVALCRVFESALARTTPYSPDHRALASAIVDVHAVRKRRARPAPK